MSIYIYIYFSAFVGSSPQPSVCKVSFFELRYVRKVKKLFQTIDASGDGAICLEEFAKLVQSLDSKTSSKKTDSSR